MFKKSASIALGLFLLASPLLAGAQTTSVQSQIDALLAQIKQLTALIAQLQAAKGGTTAASCANLTHNFGIGATDASTGGDLSRLVRFLSNRKYLGDARVDGTFNNQISSALRYWQKSVGLEGVGVVGPKTRKAMGCGGAQPSNVVLSATPTSGSAPLQVHFTRTGGDDLLVNTIGLNFGDGNAQTFCDHSVCGNRTLRHTYTTPGIYTATLSGDGLGGANSSTVTITVTGNSIVSAQTAIDTCMLTVDGQNYPISPCNEKGKGDDRLGWTFGTDTGSKYFVYFDVNDNGTYGGFWNGPAGTSHAHDRLPGELTKVGNCYQNDRVKLCGSSTPGSSLSTTGMDETQNYSGSWFKVSYPAGFTANAVGQLGVDSKTDEATFTSPDGSVQFYVYSPQWAGNPASYLQALPTETVESDTSTPDVTSSTNSYGTTYYKKVIRYVTFAAKDGSYKRSFVSTTTGYVTTPDSNDYASKTHTVFGIKYQNQTAYDKYLTQYLAFKKSLVQYAD